MTEPIKDHIPPTTPGSPPLPNETGWLGRLIVWISKSTASVFGRGLLVKSVPLEENSTGERFKSNYQTIMSLKSWNGSDLRAQQGRLVVNETPLSLNEQERVKDLIQQTYRQAWGKLIDAQHGYCIQTEAMQQLNALKDHLMTIYPEGLPKADPEKPLAILAGSERSTPDLPPELAALRTKQRQTSSEAVSKLVEKSLSFQSLEGAAKGMNPTQFISNRDTGKKLALAKSVTELSLAEEIANQQGMDDSSLFQFLGGFHELLASHLNVLLSGRLGIPLATMDRDKTIHSFVNNSGNFHDFIDNHSLEEMPTPSSQRFIFAQLITKNLDCHGENILFTPTLDPVAIDFGRILNANDTSPLRACYLQFPCLDQPINEEDLSFYKNFDVEVTMEKLTNILQLQYPAEFATPLTQKLLLTKLNLLKARLYMIQAGVKAGLNQRQLIALDLPPLSKEVEEMYRLFQKEGFWPNMDEEAPDELFGGPSDDWFGGYFAQKGFRLAWNSSFDSATNTLDSKAFLDKIAIQIEEIKKIPPEDLYSEKEQELYTTANYDWSKLPRIDLS